ncbi:MAG: hypothetical protein JW719_11390 [Pirellulales bacterium]|nr:hypothetical protein [Pirellulales bacterium]
MKLDNLIRRLRREIAVSPKKAAILGLLLLVAIWYWFPLVWGWLVPESTPTAAEPAPKTVSAQVKDEGPAALGSDSKETKTHSWKQIAQWIESDPRTVALSDPQGRTDPFDPVRQPIEEGTQQEKVNALAAAVPHDADPAGLGLVVSSTVVGPRGQAALALINGRTYRPGETVRLEHDGQAIDFQLVEIRADGVTLQRNNRQYDMRLPEPTPSGRLEMSVLPRE